VDAHTTVLVVGGTGRTGRLVLGQLLSRGAAVRAVVRALDKVPADVRSNPRLTLVEGELLSFGDEEFLDLVRDCDAVISCLGHTTSVTGIFGSPRDLVTRATEFLCRAIAVSEPAKPVRFILMSSVSVNRPGGLDTRRGSFERMVLSVLRVLMPPADDNQEAADFVLKRIGDDHRFVQWAVVRPDTLTDGDASAYNVDEGLVDSLFSPGKTARANVAGFMCELALGDEVWARWKGKLPVIVDASDLVGEWE
jgi:nucleoside-diphosphate-sugar epimerase